MPAVAILGGLSTGHGCFPPQTSTGGDSTFRINGVPIHCEGDPWAPHTCGTNTHAGALDAGSGSFRINGKAAGRIADPVDCGSAVAEGDGTFLVGD